MTRTVVLLCCEGGGASLVNIFPQCFRVLTQWLLGFIVFFSDELTKPGVPCSFDRGLEPHSGFVNSHYRCLFCEGEGGGELLVNMGLLKSISSSFWRGSDPHGGSVENLLRN